MDAAGAADASGSNFVDRLTLATDLNGSTTPAAGAKTFGPYLQRFPSNPFVADTALADDVSIGAPVVPGDGTAGWYFDTTKKLISPNDNYDCDPLHKTL
jgi:hypothetical protein